MADDHQTNNQYDILIVDDDSDVRSLLVEYLTQHQYRVLSAENGTSYKPIFSNNQFRLVIMDIVMPGEDGLALLAWTKKQSCPPPVLMLSAKGSLDDKVSGLSIGAEDYLVKPFEPRELLARIEVILRRENKQTSDEVMFGDCYYSITDQIFKKNGHEVNLTTGEHELMKIFCQHQGEILSRDFITSRIKGYQHDPFDRTIDIRITRLRKKIEDKPNAPKLLRTIRAKGYQLTITKPHSEAL